jgi:uncharacterized DUF497 family protein
MHFDWDPQKDAEIREKHGVSFEEIIGLIRRGGLIKTVINRSPTYPDQKVMLVRKGKAVFMVPFETRNGKRWLITAFFSQKYTSKYSR